MTHMSDKLSTGQIHISAARHHHGSLEVCVDGEWIADSYARTMVSVWHEGERYVYPPGAFDNPETAPLVARYGGFPVWIKLPCMGPQVVHEEPRETA